MEKRSSGSVTLVDAASGKSVTLQSSEVQPISKDTYYASRKTSGQNPDEVKAAAEAKAAKAKEAAAEAGGAAVAAGTVAGAAGSGEQFRRDLAAAKDEVDRTLASLSDLVDPAQADLSAASKRFGDQVERMKTHGQKVKVESDAMHQARDAYFAKWDARIAAVDNPTLKSEAEAKRARLRTEQEKILADSAAAKDAYQPFLADLEDTRKFLTGDTSKDTVSVLTPMVKKAQDNGRLVKERLDAVIDDLDAVEGRAAPAAAPAAAAPVAPAQTPPAAAPAAAETPPAAPAQTPSAPTATEGGGATVVPAPQAK
jgi:hypothetical protein